MTVTKILAIDPGDEHVGMARFVKFRGEWRCTSAWEATPAEAIRNVRESFKTGNVDALVVEEFRLYPWMKDNQVWSDFPTSQLIGVLKYLWAEHSKPGVLLQMQGADIKKPTQKILKARRTVSEAKRTKAGGHAFDAELHGWHYIGNTLQKETSK